MQLTFSVVSDGPSSTVASGGGLCLGGLHIQNLSKLRVRKQKTHESADLVAEVSVLSPLCISGTSACSH